MRVKTVVGIQSGINRTALQNADGSGPGRHRLQIFTYRNFLSRIDAYHKAAAQYLIKGKYIEHLFFRTRAPFDRPAFRFQYTLRCPRILSAAATHPLHFPQYYTCACNTRRLTRSTAQERDRQRLARKRGRARGKATPPCLLARLRMPVALPVPGIQRMQQPLPMSR